MLAPWGRRPAPAEECYDLVFTPPIAMPVQQLPADPGRYHPDLGMWIRAAAPATGGPRPALFLDRDGVIIEDPGYLARASDVALIPGAGAVIGLANRRGVPVIEVTNQAGIARGYYGWKEFLDVEAALGERLDAEGARIDAAFACPYHRDGIHSWAHPAHPGRKPRPGMLLAAAQLLNLDLRQSWIVGDKLADLQAGANAGLQGGLHVLTGHGREHRESVAAAVFEGFDLRLGESIRDASALLERMSEH